jgi:hypothetical protein
MYAPNNIRKFKLGRVVQLRINGPDPSNIIVGHVVGFSLSAANEVLVRVLFADDNEKELHPSKLRISPKRLGLKVAV